MLFSNSKAYHELMRSHSSMKALQILGALSASNNYMGISELCEITGLSTGTVHRVLQEMVACGFVLKNEEQKRYRCGFSAWFLAQQLQQNDYLQEAAKDEMARLNDLSLETIHLIGLEDNKGVYLAKLNCRNSIGLRSQVGGKVNLYCSAGGKALLAWQEPAWLENYLATTQFERRTENTLVDPDAFRREMEVIRARGYSLDNREDHDDILCVGAPIFGPNDKAVCAIVISAPTYRFPLETAIGYGPEVMASAAAISTKLGGTVPWQTSKVSPLNSHKEGSPMK